VRPLHRRRAVRAGLRAVEQRREVVLEVLLVLLRGLSIDARRAVLARASIRLAQPRHVDVMSQRRKRHVGRVLRQLCYAPKFR
jgi:hypothetical protein